MNTLYTFAIVLIALLGVYIAFQQWKTARDRLKLDLFDRRFSVYDASRKFVSSILTTRLVTDVALQDFTANTREAKFLCDDTVVTYLDKVLLHRAFEFLRLQILLADPAHQHQRGELAAKEAETFEWMSMQYIELDKVFTPFLKLRH